MTEFQKHLQKFQNNIIHKKTPVKSKTLFCLKLVEYFAISDLIILENITKSINFVV